MHGQRGRRTANVVCRLRSDSLKKGSTNLLGCKLSGREGSFSPAKMLLKDAFCWTTKLKSSPFLSSCITATGLKSEKKPRRFAEYRGLPVMHMHTLLGVHITGQSWYSCYLQLSPPFRADQHAKTLAKWVCTSVLLLLSALCVVSKIVGCCACARLTDVYVQLSHTQASRQTQ